MSVIDDAVKSLQAHALACTSAKVKAAPDYPVEDASILPLAVAYIASGTAQADNATTARLLLTVNVDIHFSRVTLRSAYTQLNAIIPEYFKRLAGDPTLGGAVETIIFPASVRVVPTDWNGIATSMAQFSVPLKFLETPIT